MSLLFVIDGYNIINHPQFIRRRHKSQNALEAFLQFIKIGRLAGSPRNKVLVVFDGFLGTQKELRHDADIEVVFSGKESADEKIRKLLERSVENLKNIVVVSDDKEVQLFSKAFGAKICPAEEFIMRAPVQVDQQKGHCEKEPLKQELTYTQIHKINEELKKLWLE